MARLCRRDHELGKENDEGTHRFRRRRCMQVTRLEHLYVFPKQQWTLQDCFDRDLEVDANDVGVRSGCDRLAYGSCGEGGRHGESISLSAYASMYMKGPWIVSSELRGIGRKVAPLGFLAAEHTILFVDLLLHVIGGYLCCGGF